MSPFDLFIGTKNERGMTPRDFKCTHFSVWILCQKVRLHHPKRFICQVSFLSAHFIALCMQIKHSFYFLIRLKKDNKKEPRAKRVGKKNVFYHKLKLMLLFKQIGSCCVKPFCAIDKVFGQITYYKLVKPDCLCSMVRLK